VKSLLSQRQLPREGWDGHQIQLLMRDLSLMDSNNFADNVGVGEREGRVYSSLVQERYRGMTHGVGRSGDLTAEQPKAAGSSVMSRLTHLMVLVPPTDLPFSPWSECCALNCGPNNALTLYPIFSICGPQAAHALKIAGLSNVSNVVVLPVATGMSITLSLMGAQSLRPGRHKVLPRSPSV
jgi:O-phospho-L-seryl-tRNASec:L-selenocysteinyl-tRNA synthase